MLSLSMGLVAKNTCVFYKPMHSTYMSILQEHPALHVGIHLSLLLSHTNSKPLPIRSTSENMYISVHYTGGQPCRFTINWLSSTFKAAVVKPLAHCECMGIFLHSLITSFFPHQSTLKFVCVDFKGFPNGANFILIDHCIGKLLLIK